MVREKRRVNLNATSNEIPDNISIAREGELMRILECWVGNKIDQGNPWGPVLEKVNKYLKQWGKSNSSMKGRRHIISMFVGGITFYLTKVQWMLSEIEARLEKTIREYIWDSKKPMVNLETLYKPEKWGGRNLLDLQSRNEAIHLSWLKEYMRLSEGRLKWAYLANIIIRQNARTANKIEGVRDGQNMFLQK